MNQLFFFKNFLRDGRIASMVPTAERAVRQICSSLDFRRDLMVVEYGPGEGVFTRYLLSRLTPRSRLLVIDTNPIFVTALRQIGDHRLEVISGDIRLADQLLTRRGVDSVDHVLSGIPFSFLSGTERARVTLITAGLVVAGGSFILYQFSPLMRRYLAPVFKEVQLSFVPLNLPPLFVMKAIK